jgi:hypothetical protein
MATEEVCPPPLEAIQVKNLPASTVESSADEEPRASRMFGSEEKGAETAPSTTRKISGDRPIPPGDRSARGSWDPLGFIQHDLARSGAAEPRASKEAVAELLAQLDLERVQRINTVRREEERQAALTQAYSLNDEECTGGLMSPCASCTHMLTPIGSVRGRPRFDGVACRACGTAWHTACLAIRGQLTSQVCAAAAAGSDEADKRCVGGGLVEGR